MQAQDQPQDPIIADHDVPGSAGMDVAREAGASRSATGGATGVWSVLRWVLVCLCVGSSAIIVKHVRMRSTQVLAQSPHARTTGSVSTAQAAMIPDILPAHSHLSSPETRTARSTGGEVSAGAAAGTNPLAPTSSALTSSVPFVPSPSFDVYAIERRTPFTPTHELTRGKPKPVVIPTLAVDIRGLFVGPPSSFKDLAVPEGFVGPPLPDALLRARIDAIMARERQQPALLSDPTVRWFNARPVRPSRTLWMRVTAYSPDERSCGESADGLTATLHCVTTNSHRLVAADPDILAYGTLLSVPGYAMIESLDASSAESGEHGALAAREPAIVPVLDCGGLIKGYRLDVLFPTHEEALRWGVRDLAVTIWAYADGMPADNPRKMR
jgi:3D (Asp-Asp-Asp) domain-containing protein